jgi:hypothetical protein
VILPAPLDALVAGLAAGREPPGSSLLGGPSPWLFPGRWPGRPLTDDALEQPLHALGISPRQGRSTALYALAADISRRGQARERAPARDQHADRCPVPRGHAPDVLRPPDSG